MRDGPRGFPQDSTCPVVLGRRARKPVRFRLRGYYPVSPSFPEHSAIASVGNFRASMQGDRTRSHNTVRTTPARLTSDRFGLFPVRSPLLGESRLLSLPEGTEMVHFPSFAPRLLFDSEAGDAALPAPGCPIRKSPGQSLFAAHRGLSQLTASFIDFWRQGIHRTPLVA